jgi:hypothetical protein
VPQDLEPIGLASAQDGEADPTTSGLTTGLIQRRRLNVISPTWNEAARIATIVSRLH